MVVNYWFLQGLGVLGAKSGGHIHLVPKDRDGNPISDLSTTLVRTRNDLPHPDALLKEWLTLAMYLRSFSDLDGDGIPNIPARHASPEGRVVMVGK